MTLQWVELNVSEMTYLKIYITGTNTNIYKFVITYWKIWRRCWLSLMHEINFKGTP